VFTYVTACMLAKSPRRPSTPEAPTASFPPPPLRLLPGGANQFPGGTFTRGGLAPFTAHALSRFINNYDAAPRLETCKELLRESLNWFFIASLPILKW